MWIFMRLRKENELSKEKVGNSERMSDTLRDQGISEEKQRCGLL